MSVPSPRVLATLLAALALGACANGDTDADKDTIEDPDAQLLLEPEVVFANEAPTTTAPLEASVASPQQGVTYLWAWTRDGVEQPDLTTATVPADRTAKGETWLATATPTRGEETGPPGSGGVTVRNTPPAGTLSLGPSDPVTGDDLVAALDATDADGDEVTWQLSWTLDGAPFLSDDPTIPSTATAKGQTWALRATPRDDEAAGEPVDASVTIGNTLPTVSLVTIAPTAPRTTNNLTATATRNDPDGDTVTVLWRWTVNGAPAASTTNTLPNTDIAKGDRVIAYATARDADGFGPETASAELVIGNTPPAATGARIEPAAPNGGDTLTCVGEGFTDIDGDPAGFTYQWLRAGLPIAGETQATLLPSAHARGETIACEVRPFDGDDPGTNAYQAPAVLIVNAPPVVSSVALSSLTPASGDTLTATVTALDADGDTVTLDYDWYVDDALFPSVTSNRMPGGIVRAGRRFRVVVTPSDGTVQGTPVSSAEAIVRNTAPVGTAVALSPTSPTTLTPILATPTATDPDNQSLTWTYAWTVNGAPAGGTSNTLDAALFVRGNVVQVTATPNDGIDDGTPVTSPPLTIGNAAPFAEMAVLSPAQPVISSTITCAGTGWEDADGDTARYRTTLTVNGNAVAGGLTALDNRYFQTGDVIGCVLTPFDGISEGTPIAADAVTIGNSPPSALGAVLSTTAPTVADTLSYVLQGASDPDGDSVTSTATWYVNGVEVSTSPTLGAAAWSPGDEIWVVAVPTDGSAAGAPVTSASAFAVSTPPTLSAIQLTPVAPVRTTQDLTVAWTASDPDGEAVTVDVQWFADSVAIPGATSPTLAAAETARGDTITAQLTATDASGLQTQAWSPAASIANTPPTLSGARIDPAVVFTDTPLTCHAEGWLDPDGDTESVSWIWYVNGVIAAIGQNIAPTAFDKGDVVTCDVRPFDPFGGGDFVSSPPTIVANTPPVLASATINDPAPTSSTVLMAMPGPASDLDGDTLTFATTWFVNSVEVSTDDILPQGLYGKNDIITAELVPFDGEDEGAPVTTPPVTVGNTPPVVLSADIGPPGPTINDDLVLTITPEDLDNDPLTYVVVWYVDGVEVQRGASETLPSSFLSSGVSVYAEVTPNDGFASGPLFTTVTIRIDNTPPVATLATVTPTLVYETTTATCQGGGWFDADGDPEAYRYEWYVNGTLRGGTNTINGVRFNKGNTLVCRVFPDDGTEEGTPIDSAPITVLNSAPTLSGVSLTRSSPTTLQNVGCVVQSPGDPDSDPITTTYRWTINDVTVQGVTGSQLLGSLFVKGDRIRCEATLSDGAASTTALSNEAVAVNSPPQITAVDLSPATPFTTDDIPATVTVTDADNDPVTITYAWTVDGTAVTDVTGPTFPASRTVKGQVIRVAVQASDGTATTAVVTSAPLTILNTPPVVGVAEITPNPAVDGDFLTCAGSVISDADGDSVAVVYSWTVNGFPATGSNTLSPALFARGDAVVCSARGFDGEEYGNFVASPNTTVANGPPTISGITLSTLAPREGELVRATAQGAVDPDGDVVDVQWRWEVNGQPAGTAANTLTSADFDRGDTIQAFAIASDGTATSGEVSSAIATAVNTAPFLPAPPSVSPLPASRASTLTATAVATDADSDPITITYTWRVNGAVVKTGSGSGANTLAPSAFTKGASITVSAVPNDGQVNGNTQTTEAFTVVNTAPSAPQVTLSPATPSPGDTITCTITTLSTDPDGDPISYNFLIEENNTTFNGANITATAATITGNYVSDGDVFRCRARAFDGDEFGLYGTPQQTAQQAGLASCAHLLAYGHGHSGWTTIDPDQDGGFPAFCDQTTDGGGWTRVLATAGADADLGQSTPLLARDDTDPGVDEAFVRLTHFDEVLLKATTGAQAGAWASYALVQPVGDRTLVELLAICRDEVPAPLSAWTTFQRPRVLGHSSAWAGTRVEGLVEVAHPLTGQRVPADTFHLCGVQTHASPVGYAGVSYLAFTDGPADGGTWGAGWHGLAQPFTVWSYAAGPYGPGDGHIGTTSLDVGAGFKGVGTAAEPWHQGAWEVYVR